MNGIQISIKKGHFYSDLFLYPKTYFYKLLLKSKYPKNATVWLISILCRLCLRRHSKQEKLILKTGIKTG